MRELICGTRGSKLAMIQTNWVLEQLQKAGVKHPIKIKKIDTKGDKNREVSLPSLGGRGVFLAEIEKELIEEEIDFAVHSLKDVPVELPEELTLASIPVREDHRDVLLQKDGTTLDSLPAGSVIGTSSIRRAAQILAQRPDVKTEWIRGPIDSRIEQLENGDFDAIILAAAGLNRLNIGQHLIAEYLSADAFVPSMGQGALVIETRANDTEVNDLLTTINDTETEQAVTAERHFLKCFEEGEQAPIGGYAHLVDQALHLHGVVINADGTKLLEHEAVGTNPEAVAEETANELIRQGALEIIAEVNEALRHS